MMTMGKASSSSSSSPCANHQQQILTTQKLLYFSSSPPVSDLPAMHFLAAFDTLQLHLPHDDSSSSSSTSSPDPPPPSPSPHKALPFSPFPPFVLFCGGYHHHQLLLFHRSSFIFHPFSLAVRQRGNFFFIHLLGWLRVI